MILPDGVILRLRLPMSHSPTAKTVRRKPVTEIDSIQMYVQAAAVGYALPTSLENH